MEEEKKQDENIPRSSEIHQNLRPGDNKRQTAGIHKNLHSDYLWPTGFGKMADRQSTIENVRKNQENVDNQSTVHSQQSKQSKSKKSSMNSNTSAELQKKRIAFEAEKQRQAIANEILMNKMKLIDMEQDIKEAEVEELQSQTSGSLLSLHEMNHDKKSVSQRQSAICSCFPEKEVVNIQQFPNQIHGHHNEMNTSHKYENMNEGYVADWINSIPENRASEEKSDIKLLCETMVNVLKSTTSKTEKLGARQIIERDFPIFDGKTEDWPTFFHQFNKISSLCDYSPEEKLIKLQKCLKGEAKFAVAGMLMTPENLELVIRTLKMRFGRPDQIIDSVLQRIRRYPTVRDHDMENLIQLSSQVRSLVATIKSVDCEYHLQNPQLIRDIVQKLPDSLKLRWGELVMQSDKKNNLGDFADWLFNIASAASFVSNPRTSEKIPQDFHSGRKRFERTCTTSISTSNSNMFCTYCTRKGHSLENCTRLKDDDVETRWSTVTTKKLCFSCLKGNHQTMKCRSKKACGINGCTKPHNQFLHKESQGNTSNSMPLDTPGTSNLTNESVLTLTHPVDNNVLLRMIRVRLYGKNETFLETTALFDEGSTVTLIDKSIIERLSLNGKIQPLCLQWTNNIVSKHENSILLNMEISGISGVAKRFTMKNVRSVEDLSLPYQKVYASHWKKYHHLKGIPITDIFERPMILIGQDNIRLSVARKISQGPENLPIATKTCLGWSLHGKYNDDLQKNSFSFHVCNQETSDKMLHEMVKASFTTDAFGVSVNQTRMNKAETRAVDIMEKTAKRVGDNFEIGLLWKTDDISLPASKSTAFRRLQCIERQMEKDNDFGRKYRDNIKKYVDKGYARKLTKDEAKVEGPRCWYLPHFGVVNPNKPEKLRLVFDAASKSNGTSLNDNLLAGPDLLQSLVAILLKFRQREVAFCSDVREMFHQVRIRPEDQCSQRFLWRDGNTKNECDIYQMQVMIFGATCSPTCAQFIKNLNAQQQTSSKNILDAITKKHYVDDYLDCTNTVEEAIETITEVRRIQKMAGFDLVNWISNSKQVMTALSIQDEMKKDINLDDKTIHRILGLSWNPDSDSFIFKLKMMDDFEEPSKRPTKRQILKIVMSVFDPLGLIVNFTIRGRIIIQDVWKSGIGWDDCIDEEIYKTWKFWKKDLQRIDNLSIPRSYAKSISISEVIELHIFCDSSKKAFASVAYLRSISQNNIEICLVLAKARVAPTKTISIPRLELQAAVMGSRMGKFLREELEFEINKIYYWSDSTTVLYWIKGQGNRLGQFESHRVGEIQELTDIGDWNWIPSKFNAADIATRTYSEDGGNETNFEKWFRGPDFLYSLDKCTWPTQNSATPEEIPDKNECVTFVATIRDVYLPNLQRFSKLFKLLKSTAYVIRWIKIMKIRIGKCQDSFPPTYISVEELEEAERRLIKHCQYESFLEDIELLKSRKPIRKQSKLFQLSPALDDYGLLVLSGRTDLATCMESRAKRPIILPKKHDLTRLIIRHYHEKFAHQGVETVLNEIRQKYWVIDGRSAVKSVFADCQLCKVKKAKPVIPLMGQIPKERLTPNVKPFTFVGMDYFGPLMVTVGRRSEKRWGVIFTCLSVRAIHLEVAHSLTTDSTIMALRRMIARRGSPKVMISDNGTNLRGASKELRKAIEELNTREINEEMILRSIEWKYNSPASSHMGGIWERLIRSVKNSFYTILQNRTLKDELLLTLFAEVESIINARPIIKVSTDPNDLEALTPNHFIMGSSNRDCSYSTIEDSNLRCQWRKAQQIANEYWRRWIREYLPSLTKRSKWCDDGKPIEVNDIVFVIEENCPRNKWKLGKIENVYPGPDGRIRVVDVKTKNGIFRRPVTKLARFEMKRSEEVSSRGEEM